MPRRSTPHGSARTPNDPTHPLWAQYAQARAQRSNPAIPGAAEILIRNQLAEALAHFLAYHAHAMALKNRFRCAEEFEQDGFLGLLDAIEDFDPSLGFRFISFAHKRIRGAMESAIRRIDWGPRAAQAQDEPSSRKLLDAVRDHREEPPEAPLERADLVGRLLHSLTASERRIITFIYVEGLEQAEIAAILRVSAPRISQIHRRALRKLQHELRQLYGWRIAIE